MPKGTSGKLRGPRIAPPKTDAKKYHIQMGTRNALGPVKHYATVSSCKDAALQALYEWEMWCRRHNNAGVTAVATARDQVNLFNETVTGQRHRIECEFDPEMTGSHLVIVMWKDQ